MVVPCYNEEESLPLFYKEITRVAAEMSAQNPLEFEFLFVNDGSRDKTLALLRDLSATDARVRYISFSRNFGKESAMLAGLRGAVGDYVVILDADLQHPPAFIKDMYGYVSSGEFDSAATRRISRKGESKLLSFFARKFYRLMNRISQTEIVDGAQDFRFMTRTMVDAILAMEEYNRFSKGIFSWVGFSTKYIEYENVERIAGKSSFNFVKLFQYSLEGIFAFSTVPLAISSLFGVLFCIIAFIMIVAIVIKTLMFGDPVAGYPTLICVIFLIGGIQLFCLGILGQYLSKTYMETKRRPAFVIKETEKSRKKS